MIIDGHGYAKECRQKLAASITTYVNGGSRKPKLAVVLVGEDPASQVYVRAKERAAAEVGIDSVDYRLASSTSQAELLSLVGTLNNDRDIDGILVQLPLPEGLDSDLILDAIDPAKDVDGFHPHNIGLLSQRRPRFLPATPAGCMKLLRHADTKLEGALAVVVGRSNIVGKPMGMLLVDANATVVMTHSRTQDLPGLIKKADILVAAVGRPHFVKGEWLKPGATIIDVGINRIAPKKLVGDVDFESAKSIVRAITPVPRGVGPMTIACLLENTFEAAKQHAAASNS